MKLCLHKQFWTNSKQASCSCPPSSIAWCDSSPNIQDGSTDPLQPDPPDQLQIKRPSPDAVLTHPRDIKAKNMPSQLAGCSHIVSRPTKIWVCWNQLIFRGILNSQRLPQYYTFILLRALLTFLYILHGQRSISPKKHIVIMSHMTQ